MADLDIFAPVPRTLYGGQRVMLYDDMSKPPALKAVLDTYTASVAAAEAVATNVANKNFELLGTGAVTADMLCSVEGGLAFATHGGSTDSCILVPHLATNQSAWTKWTWGTDRSVNWGCWFRTDAALTNTTIWCGLKLTNTPTIATDNDQVVFKYVNGTDTNWQCTYSISGTDVTVDSGVAVAAATSYRFWITIDANRVARFWINGALVATSTALASVDLKPYIGVLSATDATVKQVFLYETWISRLVAAA